MVRKGFTAMLALGIGRYPVVCSVCLGRAAWHGKFTGVGPKWFPLLQNKGLEYNEKTITA